MRVAVRVSHCAMPFLLASLGLCVHAAHGRLILVLFLMFRSLTCKPASPTVSTAGQHHSCTQSVAHQRLEEPELVREGHAHLAACVLFAIAFAS
jgi:hypothetical protein